MTRSRTKKAWAFGLLLFILLGFSLSQEPWKNFETNILMFLPSDQGNPNSEILAKFDQSQSNLSSFLLCSEDFSAAKRAAEISTQNLRGSGLFSTVSGKLRRDYLTQFQSFYQAYPSIGTAQGLGGNPTEIINRQQRLLMQVGGSLGQLQTDPLLLRSSFPDFKKLRFGDFIPREDWLSLQSKEESCIFISAVGSENALDAKYQDDFLLFYDAWGQDLKVKTPEVRLIGLSLVRFAGVSKAKIQADLATITLVSLGGIFLLLKFIFPGFRSFGAAHIALVSGGIFGFSATLLIYGKIHLIALALGATLTGVAIDYVFHYLTERYFTKDQNSEEALAQVMPGINLGLITSIIGYSGFFFAPIAGIQQTAVFAIFGLIGAWLSLQIFFPLFFQETPRQPNAKILPLFKGLLRFWSKYGLAASFLVFAASLAYLSTGLPEVNDDIRSLNSLPQELKQEAQFFAETSKMPDLSRFLLVTAKDPETLLQRLETLTSELDLLQSRGKIKGYVTASGLIPSKKRQAQKEKEIQVNILGNQKELAGYLSSMGFDSADIQNYFTQWAGSLKSLSLQEWLEHPVSAPWRSMWYTSDSKLGTAVYLSAGFESQDLSDLNIAGVSLVDRAGMISESFGGHRQAIIWVLLAAYGFIFYFLWVNEGLANAFWIILPPFVGAVNVTSFLKFAGLELNLFHMLAMILILGIGIDYSIFYYHSKRGENHKVTLAVFTSLITTLLSFGALGLSGVAALQTLGSALVIGLISAFLVSSISSLEQRQALPKMPLTLVKIDQNVRRTHNMVFCGIAFVLFGLGGSLLVYVFFPFVLLFTRDKNARRASLQKLVSYGFHSFYLYLDIFGLIKGEIQGLEHVKNTENEKVIFVANHPSLLDFVLVGSALPKVVCMVKPEVWKNPFLSNLAKGMGYVPFSLNDSGVELCKTRIAEGFPLLIFPEGTRSPAGRLGKFSKVAAFIALSTGAKIIPVKLSISDPILIKGWKWWQVMAHKVTMKAEFSPAFESTPFLESADGDFINGSRILTEKLVDFFNEKPDNQKN